MKSLILIAALTLAGQAFAQQSYTSAKISSSRRVLSQITPEMSYTGSILDGDTNQDLDGQRTGVGAGFKIDIGRSDFVFETGFAYRQMGGMAYLYTAEEAQQKGLTSRMAAEVELNYASIPLMAKYYINGRDTSSFIIRGGLQPSLLIFKEARLQNNNTNAAKDLSSLNDFDLVGAIGVGWQISLNETTLLVMEGTYLRGLTSAFNNQALYNNGFSGSFGLGILL